MIDLLLHPGFSFTRTTGWHVVCDDCAAGFADVGNTAAVSESAPVGIVVVYECCFCPQEARCFVSLIENKLCEPKKPRLRQEVRA